MKKTFTISIISLSIHNHRPCRHRVANVDAQALPVVLVHDR